MKHWEKWLLQKIFNKKHAGNMGQHEKNEHKNNRDGRGSPELAGRSPCACRPSPQRDRALWPRGGGPLRRRRREASSQLRPPHLPCRSSAPRSLVLALPGCKPLPQAPTSGARTPLRPVRPGPRRGTSVPTVGAATRGGGGGGASNPSDPRPPALAEGDGAGLTRGGGGESGRPAPCGLLAARAGKAAAESARRRGWTDRSILGSWVSGHKSYLHLLCEAQHLSSHCRNGQRRKEDY